MYNTIEEVIEAINMARLQFETLNNAASAITSKVNKQGNYIVSTATNADQLALKTVQEQCDADPFAGLEESIKKLVLTPKPAVKPKTKGEVWKAKVPAKKKTVSPKAE